MSHGTIKVITQYYDENGKPKSMQEFHIPLKSDMIDVSSREDREKAIKKMLADFDNGSVIRHEYVDHDICFFDAIKLDGEKFENELGTILRGEA